jgi:uncharacterized protein (TIGR03118 family)
LLNPWGNVFPLGGPFWINDNGSGISALYQGDGTQVSRAGTALKVTIPPPQGGTPPSAPTGIVRNTSSAFKLHDGSAASFIFATEDGTISAWDIADGFPGPAELMVPNANTATSCNSGTAVYKGLALGTNTTGVFLYATNFRCARIDVFNSSFAQDSGLSAKFRDPLIPRGFAPFGIATIDGNLFVSYAKQDSRKHDDVAGKGNGFVDIYDTNGNLIERFATRGTLNSPWGIAQAPFNFGIFSADVLIGNFGDGRINAFNSGGQFQGQLKNPSSKTIAIDGLWSLLFGGGLKSDPGTLYFTAGPNREMDGLFGSLSPK